MPSDDWSGWRGWTKIAAFVALYFVLMGIAYTFAWDRGLASALWWNPSGLAIGVLMRAPRRVWPRLLASLGVVVLVGGLLGIPAPRHPPPVVAVIWAVCDVCVPLLGAWLLTRLGRHPFTLRRPREVPLFLVAGVILPAILSALFTSLGWTVWPGDERPVFSLWSSWWTSEALGILSFAPLLLTWPVPGERVYLSSACVVEAAALALCLLAASIVAFGFPSLEMQILALGFTASPLLAWAAIRFGARGAAWASFVLGVVSISQTLGGYGPFASEKLPYPTAVAYAGAYFAVAAVSALLLAAFATERRRVMARQRLLLEAGNVLVEPSTLAERLQRVTEQIVSTELARTAELRIGAQSFMASRTVRHLPEPHESERRSFRLDDGDGTLELEAMPELGYFDEIDSQAASSLATRVWNAVAAIEAESRVRAYEAELAELTKFTAMARLARGITHDLGNLFGVVQVSAALIDRQAESPMLREVAGNLREVVQIAVGLCEQLEQAARPDHVPEPLVLDAALLEMEPLLRSLVGEERSFHLAITTEGARVRIAVTSLKQVLMNLVVNAREATPVGGRIEVRALLPADASAEQQKMVMLEVHDTGGGIEPALASRVFEPHFSTKGENRGIGLPLVRWLVELVGGGVEVESALGVGTRFRIKLPRAP